MSTRKRMPAAQRRELIVGVATERDAQPRDLGETAGNQRGEGVLSQTESLNDARGDGNDVFEGASDFDADDVGGSRDPLRIGDLPLARRRVRRTKRSALRRIVADRIRPSKLRFEHVSFSRTRPMFGSRM